MLGIFFQFCGSILNLYAYELKASADVTHSGGETFTTRVERPEHGVTQTLQNFQQHLQTKMKKRKTD